MQLDSKGTHKAIINNQNLKKMSTKILVFKDEAQIEKTIYCLQEFTPKLNVLLQEYERLKIGKFSNDAFKQLKEDKGENAAKLYYESVNKELDKIGIENEVTRAGLLKGHENTIEDFKSKVNEVLNDLHTPSGFVELNYIDYSNGKFIVSSESKELIKERYSIYLESKQEIELYEALKDLFNATEKFKSKMTLSIGYELPEHVKTMDLIKDNFIKEYNRKLTFEAKNIKQFLNRYKQK